MTTPTGLIVGVVILVGEDFEEVLNREAQALIAAGKAAPTLEVVPIRVVTDKLTKDFTTAEFLKALGFPWEP